MTRAGTLPLVLLPQLRRREASKIICIPRGCAWVPSLQFTGQCLRKCPMVTFSLERIMHFRPAVLGWSHEPQN